MVATAVPDVRDLLLGTGPFGPTEVRRLIEALGRSATAHRDLRGAVKELEGHADRSPAASVKLGICQRLLGRAREALETLRTGDGGALALFHQGLAHAELGAGDKAREAFAAARKSGYAAGDCAAAGSADCCYASGAVAAAAGRPLAEVVAAYEKALALDPGHPRALFAMGVIHDRLGNDEEARACYEKSLERYPPSVGSLLNLGVMMEDAGDFTRAQQCYKRILEAVPDHPRARLFLRDSTAAGDLQLGELELKQRDRLDQVLGLPVSDFELSVRSRNCLQKMGIYTLGDLARTTEEEILASKNFGETSLVEIKEMLASKGLSLGQIAAPAVAAAEEAVAAEPEGDELEIYALPIAELNLSVRAKKCTTKLGIVTIGDLARRTAEDLLECKNFGVTSLNEVREKLAERGLKLRGD
jgi:DNA-directed RNA polymerase subunit alpha